MKALEGRVWKFGDDIDTDLIVPGKYLDAPVEESAPHVLEGIRPDFAAGVREGDIIVAGANFGCGSSREQAPEAIKALGISCVVAESFARIFFRNSIAIGLPAIICPNISKFFKDGDIARVEVEKSVVENRSAGKIIRGEPLCEEMLVILEAGGIINVLRSMMGGRA